MTDKMREEFEAAHDSGAIYRLEVSSVVKFGDYRRQCAWAAWQASRAALVVELPDSEELHSPYGSETYRVARDEFCDALESAGVTVK